MENKIFELDELGNTVFTLRGSNSFFSADRVEEEKGVYTSEIFDGTNDLVKWEFSNRSGCLGDLDKYFTKDSLDIIFI